MRARFILAFGALIGTTSCVGSAVDTAPPALAAAPRAVAPVPPKAQQAIPGAPPAALLANAPPPDDSSAMVVAAPPFQAVAAGADDAARALDCLTQAIYYEARSEPVEGQEAVAQVVLNRVRNPAFPNSVCGTVYEGASRRTGCQFTFTCDGSLAARRESGAWDRARRVAAQALAGFVYEPVGAATYYHTFAVHPWWDARVSEVAQIGAHRFFQLPGAWGGPLAFRQAYGGVEPTPAVAVRMPEKATARFIEAIEAGVTVHRGGTLVPIAAGNAATPDAPVAEPAVARRFGVEIHRAADTAPSALDSGVHVYRGSTDA